VEIKEEGLSKKKKSSCANIQAGCNAGMGPRAIDYAYVRARKNHVQQKKAATKTTQTNDEMLQVGKQRLTCGQVTMVGPKESK